MSQWFSFGLAQSGVFLLPPLFPLPPPLLLSPLLLALLSSFRFCFSPCQCHASGQALQ